MLTYVEEARVPHKGYVPRVFISQKEDSYGPLELVSNTKGKKSKVGWMQMRHSSRQIVLAHDLEPTLGNNNSMFSKNHLYSHHNLSSLIL